MRERTTLGKREVRAKVRFQRAALTPEQRDRAAEGLGERIASLVAELGARSISCYLPVGDEPDTRLFLLWAREHGIEVLLPVSRDDGLLDWVRDEGAGYVTGLYGIPEPSGSPVDSRLVARVDLMLIPACAVDRSGMRLGWGRGYFDRLLGSLAHRPPVFAVVYDADVLESVPVEPHDIPVAGAVTPERTLVFSR